MATVVSYDKRYNSNKSANSSTARGIKQVTGAINFSGLNYADGGVTNTFAGFATLGCVLISPQRGLTFEYDYANGKVVITAPGAASATATILATADGVRALEIASDTALSTFTAVKFWAVGY